MQQATLADYIFVCMFAGALLDNKRPSLQTFFCIFVLKIVNKTLKYCISF